MNREDEAFRLFMEDVPRTRGDEPDLEFVHADSILCSPHTRG